MKSIVKKVLVSALAATLLVSGVACGGGGDDRDPNTLTIAFAKSGYGEEWLTNALEAFKAEVKPDLQWELEGDPNITVKILPRLESGTELPDLFFSLETNWQMWAYQDYLEPMDDLYSWTVEDGQGKTYEDKVEDDLLNYGKVNGHYYATSWNSGASGLVYNASMFEEHGWEVPTTVEELYALCEQIRNDPVNKDDDRRNDIAPFAWGGQVGSYWQFFIEALWAQWEGIDGVREFFELASPDVYKQEGRLKALEVFEELMSEPGNSVSGAMSKNHIQSQMDFVNGNGAMIPNGAWIETEMMDSLPDGFEMRMMPTPFIDEDHEVRMNWTSSGDFIVIPKDIPEANKQLAKEFLLFLAREDQLQAYTKTTGTPRGFEYDLDAIKNDMSPFGQSVIEIYQNSTNIFAYSNNPLYYANLANRWPASGSPYGLIADGESAQSVWQMEIDKAESEWDTWLSQIQ